MIISQNENKGKTIKNHVFKCVFQTEEGQNED